MAEGSNPLDTAVILSSFAEIDPTAAALERLQGLGIPDDDITVMSSLPYSAEILGRPHVKTRLPVISLVAALLGLGTGIVLTMITPYLYIIRVGGQPIVPIPPTALLLYEFIMLFLILGTFGGFLALNHFPASQPQYYDPELTNGRISLVVHSPADKTADVVAIMEAHGGEVVQDPERRTL
jgi:hypothetical protein